MLDSAGGETQCVRCGAMKISWESFRWHPFSSGSSAWAGRQPGEEEGDFFPLPGKFAS